MKKALLRVIALLAVCVLASCTVFSFAASGAAVTKAQPRWIQLSTYQCYIERKDGWFTNVHVGSSASTHSAYSRLEMTVTLQVMSGGDYVDTDRVWTASGSGAAGIGKDIKLSTGNYRARSEVKVYSSDGVYLETVTKYSNDILI